MFASQSVRRGVLVLFLACALLGGCHTHPHKNKQPSPEQLYQQAHKRLDSYDYKDAIKIYETLTARFPFTDQARQSRLDLIYAYYRDGETESAIDAAETFIRENPTHPRVDYAWYVKGLVDFERMPNVMEKLFHADLTKRPPSNARKSFEAFRTVVEQYPKSQYAHDSLQRMIYLRNRLADYEVHVADYYMRRGAFVGAAQRANHAIEDYDGAPSTQHALQIMIACYDRLGLNDRAQQTRQVYALNFPTNSSATQVADRGRPWWKLW
jgi:outer membrane protein assembly factor BamD